MNTDTDKPGIDYTDIARRYNELPIGRVILLPRVYHITNFRRRLESRGLTYRVDFKVYHQGRHCVIRRLRESEMQETAN